jgi:hypothetical protein
MKLEARLTAANVATLECEPGKSESIYWDPIYQASAYESAPAAADV